MTNHMPHPRATRLLPLLATPLLLAADTVRLENGDQLTGKVVKIHDGVVSLETAYAGVISITQANIAGMALDAPANIREATGTRVAEGALDIGAVQNLWLPGAPDPGAKTVPDSSWNFSLAAEARHSSGNTRNTEAKLEFEAHYINPESHTLKLFTGLNYNKTDGSVSDHDFTVGADAGFFVSEHSGLYARETLLTDRPNDIRVRSTFGSGFERFLYKNPVDGDLEMFRLRAGLGHRYEKHRGDGATSNSAMTLDFGARFHKHLFDLAAWTTEVTYTPAVNDFANYLVTHDSRCGFNLVKKWRLTYELGVTHEYNSSPAAGNVYLDSTYYTRIRKTW